MPHTTEDTLIVVGAGLVVGWLIWRELNGPQTQAQKAEMFDRAGFTVTTDQAYNDRIFVTTQAGVFSPENVTYSFKDSDRNLNLAQRILIGLDSWIPGTFLSRWALE